MKNVTFTDLMDIEPDGSYNHTLDTSKIPPGIYELKVNYGPSTTGVEIKIEPNWELWTPLKQFNSGISFTEILCQENLLRVQKYDGSPACVKPETKQKLVERGWAENDSSKISESNESSDAGLQVHVTGEQQVRRGTTHDITVDVTRNGNPVSDSLVIITIEDYGKDIIREFKGKTDGSGRFVFSWEIPKSFDDIETLLAYIDVTDDISAKTILFKFQVYCLPGESGCKVEGN